MFLQYFQSDYLVMQVVVNTSSVNSVCRTLSSLTMTFQELVYPDVINTANILTDVAAVKIVINWVSYIYLQDQIIF